MKKFFTLLMLACGMTVSAQNIQLHYDFGRNIYTGEEAGRQKVTITLEQFKADQWGQWYYFVDFDLSRHFVESAYTEISREIKLGKESPLVTLFCSYRVRRRPEPFGQFPAGRSYRCCL